MVANAHHEQDPEGMKIFDRGYLVGVSIFVILLNILPPIQFSVHGIPDISYCLGEGGDQSFATLMVIAAVLCFLIFIFLVLTSFRTQRNLNKIGSQHLKNLPAKNALTFLGRD